MTECGGVSHICPPSQLSNAKHGSCGVLLPDVECKVNLRSYMTTVLIADKFKLRLLTFKLVKSSAPKRMGKSGYAVSG